MKKVKTTIQQWATTPELMLHCLLIWLGGGLYLNIRLSAGMRISSTYRVIYGCFNAVLIADELSYSFPMTEQSQDGTSHHFSELKHQSSSQWMHHMFR